MSAMKTVKYKIHIWNGERWAYLCTINEPNEDAALKTAIRRFSSNYFYKIYPLEEKKGQTE